METTHFHEIKGKAGPVQVQVTNLFTVACTGGLIEHLRDTPTVANLAVASYEVNTEDKKLKLPVIIVKLKGRCGLCSFGSQPCVLLNPRLDQWNTLGHGGLCNYFTYSKFV